ncbi:MAG: putative amidoligase domain-containing protein [Bacillota bacterium]
MGAAQVKPIVLSPEQEPLPGTARPQPRLLLAERAATRWLLAYLPPGWSVRREADEQAEGDETAEILVRWGSLAGPEGKRLTLNTLEALSRARDPATVMETWQASRVRALSRQESASVRRRLRVDVFNGRVLAMHVPGHRGRLRPFAWERSREGALVAWHAMRALHALRLDFGAVTMGVQGLRTYALGVEPCPGLTPTLAARYAAALDSLQSGGQWWPGDPPVSQTQVVLGADPEFVLRDRVTGRAIPASDFFPRYGLVGCDRQLADRGTRDLALAEVRPAPCEDPSELVEQIRSALVQASLRMPSRDIEWVAGSRPFTRLAIGGHVHFSGLTLTRPLLTALDNYLALPVMMIERAATARLRRHRYGFLGDVRMKDHGGFEYRTLGSWLVSPNLARAVLALAKLVAADHQFLRRDWLADPARQEAFHGCQKDGFHEIMPEVWRDLEAAPGYSRYSEHLALLRSMLEQRQRWNEQVDLRSTWGV